MRQVRVGGEREREKETERESEREGEEKDKGGRVEKGIERELSKRV